MPYILGLKNDVFQSQFKNILGNSTFCWTVVYSTRLAQHAVYLYGIKINHDLQMNSSTFIITEPWYPRFNFYN